MQGSARNRSDRDVQRYKAAANAALEQLDWVISYLNRIGRRSVAETLRRNRENIARRVR